MRLTYVGDARSIHTQRWVRWFAARHDVSLIATAPDEALADLTVSILPSGRGLRLASSVLAVRRAIARHRPDVVHAHYINEAGWFAAAARHRPFVITAWGSDLYRAPVESGLAARLNPWALRSADWVTCDSDDQARVARSWGVSSDRLSVISWGVDRQQFHPGVDGDVLRSQLGIPAEAPVVLSPRQWLPNSNIETIIEAHAQLPGGVYLVLKRIPRFEHDGQASGVEAAIEASPQRDRIRVLGEIPAAELPALYAAADAVVSICDSDGTSVSVLEAMAIGKPVVALDNPSLAEWLSEPGGRLLPGRDAGEIAKALDAFLADRQLRDRAAVHNLAIVERRADRAALMSRMEAIYERLAGETAG